MMMKKVISKTACSQSMVKNLKEQVYIIKRISKLLSEKDLCSRREADELIQLGLVKVDGRVAKIGEKCNYDSILTIDKKPLKHTIILNKPLGFVSSQPEKNYKPAITLITKNNYHGNNKNLNLDKFFFKKLAVAGRLDINSSGLLIFTQDGVIAKKIIGNDSSIEKEYLVRTYHNITNKKLNELKNVDRIYNKPIKKFKVSKLKVNLLKFIS